MPIGPSVPLFIEASRVAVLTLFATVRAAAIGLLSEPVPPFWQSTRRIHGFRCGGATMGATGESMRHETLETSARDSSHKSYTMQGVKLLSSAITEKAAEAGNLQCESLSTSRPRAGSCDEPPTKLKLGAGGPGTKGRREKQSPGPSSRQEKHQREP